MRSDLEVKYMLAQALQNTVHRAFLKRQFVDGFTEEELVKVKEIDEFLKTVSLHRNNPMFEDKRVKYLCLVFRGTYTRINGTEIECFISKYINQEDFDYKIPYFVAKCIYRLAQKRCVEVFFTVNTLKALPNERKKYIPDRKRENVFSSSSLYVDLDLPSELTHLGNEEILSLLRMDYEELFLNVKPSMIVRSGSGCHLYYCFEESFYLRTEEQLFFYMDMIRNLQRLFECYGADPKCTDCTRILRVINSKNRKEKYGAEGKDISIIYNSGKKYDVFDIDQKLKFLLQGGMRGLCESVLEDMFSDSDSAIENTPEEMLEDEERELQEEKVEELELEPRKRKVSANVQKLIDLGYKGVQAYYDYNGESYFQAKDIMCWIQNRAFHEGVRHILLFFFNYNWYVFNGVQNYEEMLKRSQKLNNTYFKPMLSETELIQAVRSSFYELSKRKHNNRSIRNTTIQAYLHFTEEEKQYCCIGLYCDSYTDYQRALAQRKRKLSKEQYQREIEANGTTRKTEAKERCKKLLEENPLISYQEFKQQTGLSKSSFDSYKRELGNSKEKHYQEQRDYYLQPFKSNPDISCKEYMEKLSCSRSTYNKYKKIFIERYI